MDSKLTETEKEILHLLTDEFLTVKQIAIRRQTSDKAVYKVLKKLKEKGAYNIGLQRVEKKRGTIQPSFNQIRLHGQEFNIQIIFKDIRYKKLLNKTNRIEIDGNVIRLYNDSIEIYVGQSFYADDAQKATSTSMHYLQGFLARLEHELNLILVKPRSQNIKQVKAEYAEINNEVAKDYHDKREKLRIYANDDNKLCYVIDYSLSMHEFEAVHPKTSKQDIEKVKDVFNDIRSKDIDMPSDTKTMIKDLALTSSNMLEQQKQSLLTEKKYALNIERHLKVQTKTLRSLHGIELAFKKFNRLLSERQTKIGEHE